MREVQEKLYDDLLYAQNEEKVEAATTVSFAIDGQEFTIDLTEANAEAFRETVRPFAEAATPVTKRASSKRKSGTASTGAAASTGGSAKKPTSKDADEQNQQIREWARENGFELSERGRLPKHVRDAWAEAQHKNGALSGDVSFDRLTDEQPPAEPTFDAVADDNAEADQGADERV